MASASGVVTAVDADLSERSGPIHADPHGAGWLFDSQLDAGAGTADLLSAVPAPARFVER